MTTLRYRKFIRPSKNEQENQNGKAHVLGPYLKLINTQLLHRNGASCIRQLHFNFISTTFGTSKVM